MNSIISGIKNIVVIIVASEFLKSFLIGDKFKKYITVCVNILVIGFIITQIRNVPLNFDASFEMPEYNGQEYTNIIKSTYEQQVSAEIKKRLKKNKIMVYGIETVANDDYTVKKMTLHINGSREKAEEILKGLDLENYEIIIDTGQNVQS